MADFVHLHLHSNFSMLDGMLKVPHLITDCKKWGMPAVALTDHGNMYGLVDFYKAAKEGGIKPLLGVESYLALNGRHDRSDRNHHRHQLFIARNMQGYLNLVEMISLANIEGYYYNPTIDKELVERFREGLIALSGCLSGEIPRLFHNHLDEDAYKAAAWWVERFGEDFYIELQRNGVPGQEEVNAKMLALARHFGIKVVATVDVHYRRKEDARAHEVMLCIGNHATLEDEKRFKIDTHELYLKSPEEMAALFHDLPEALANTLEVADKVETFDITRKKHILPRFPVPGGACSEEDHLRDIAFAGLEARLRQYRSAIPREQYHQRLEYELGVVNRMGYAGYYLIVADFINWAKGRGIAVGPGRGSGAGSLIAYCINITELDPLRYNLLFERFLNPERVSMPDFDVDFCKNRRDEVIHYLRETYGKENVAMIATFQTVKARNAVRDVARVLGLPPVFADGLAKLIPERDERSKDEKKAGMTEIEKALHVEPKLKVRYDQEADARRVLDLAGNLEGVRRQTGKHPGGTVIAPQPVHKLSPVTYDKEKDFMVVQYSKDVLDDVGLVKFDLLGLKTLTIIQEALNFANQSNARKGAPPLDTTLLYRLDDPEVFALFCRAETDNVFQSESEGFKRMLRDLKPDCIEDIIAAVAMYRPGPMDNIPTLIRRKHGQEPITYDLPQLEPILKETYGVIVYQEQVMQIPQAVAGFTLGGADILRRAMGKKKQEEMDKMRSVFLTGAQERGVDAKLAQEIFDKVDKFAGYGFNKSHAAVYAMLSYQTAWLKVHYPVEFMASVMSIDAENIDKIVRDVAAVRAMGLTILPPSVNHSQADFTVEDNAIRFGLSAVRGVGKGAIEAIVKAREDMGPFTDIYDFCARVELRKVNRGVVEALVKSGALDSEGRDRAALMDALDAAIQEGQAGIKKGGMKSLFDVMAPAQGSLMPGHQYADLTWTESEKLKHERDALGFYLSGHPLNAYRDLIPRVTTHTPAKLEDCHDYREMVSVAGVLENVTDRATKTGKGRWARGIIDAPEGRIRFVMFSKAYDRCASCLTREDEAFLITGKIEKPEAGGEDRFADPEAEEGREITLRVEDMTPLSELRQESSHRLVIHFPGRLVPAKLKKVQDTLRAYQGDCDVQLRLSGMHPEADVTVRLPSFYRVNADAQMMEMLRRVVGQDKVWTE